MRGEQFSSGSRVVFRLRDVLIPDLERIREETTPELEVAGEVMFLSDHGTKASQFAIVSVGGTMSPLIIPVDRLRRIAQASSMMRETARRHLSTE